MFTVDSDFRDNHRKVSKVSRYNSGYLIIIMDSYHFLALQMVWWQIRREKVS